MTDQPNIDLPATYIRPLHLDSPSGFRDGTLSLHDGSDTTRDGLVTVEIGTDGGFVGGSYVRVGLPEHRVRQLRWWLDTWLSSGFADTAKIDTGTYGKYVHLFDTRRETLRQTFRVTTHNNRLSLSAQFDPGAAIGAMAWISEWLEEGGHG